MKEILMGIGDYEFKLDLTMQDCEKYIKDKSTKRIGFMAKRVFPVWRGEKGYFSWNCCLKCFGNRLSPDLYGSGIFQTSAGVIFSQGKINRMRLALLGVTELTISTPTVDSFMKNIYDKCKELYGDSIPIRPNLNTLAHAWEDKDSRFTVEILRNVNKLTGGCNIYITFGRIYLI